MNDRSGLMVGNSTRLAVLIGAVFLAAMLRLVPHPPNFSPIAAMALFSGALLADRRLALVAPIAALLVSDAILGFYPEVAFVYASVVLAVFVGGAVGDRRRSPLMIAGAALASSMLFFTVTNFGVWLLSGIYPMTAGGLAACYVAAVPFLQNTIAGDLVFSLLLFGGFALAERQIPLLRGVPQPA